MSRIVFRSFGTKMLALAGLLALVSGAAATTGLMSPALSPVVPMVAAVPVATLPAPRKVTVIKVEQQANGGTVVIYLKPDGGKRSQLVDAHGKVMQDIRL